VSSKKRVGVIGTMVWDVIYGRSPLRQPLEEWGGIAYSLSALDAALESDWEIVPIIRVGSDLIARAREFAGTLRNLSSDAALIEVPYPNNRVVLRYVDGARRTEVLSGGIPPWTWLGLKPLLHRLDALYINMTSGFELDLETAKLIRQQFRGPVYCDLHSLFLALEPSGLRTARELPDSNEWFSCFDFVQLNEEEVNLMSQEPMQVATTALNGGTRCLFVTLGSRGAVYFAAPGFERLADRVDKSSGAASGPVRTALLPAAPTRADSRGDPTGCGDVWGATCFSRLLAGDSFASAMNAAMSAAARNYEHQGASGLARYLRGGIATS
jgi:sugar/nucleoside kinase (ribokinase family)